MNQFGKHSALLVVSGLLFANLSLAAGNSQRNRGGASGRSVSSDSISTSSAKGSASAAPARISLGMTTYTGYPGSSGTGLSGLFEFDGGNSIQAFLGMGFSSGFSVGAGGIFRHDIKASGDSGFHVGGGLTLGLSTGGTTAAAASLAAAAAAALGGGAATVSSVAFGLQALGVGGFHVAVPGTSGNLVAHFDAALGLGFTIPAAFYYNFGGLSPALGMSLHYAL